MSSRYFQLSCTWPKLHNSQLNRKNAFLCSDRSSAKNNILFALVSMDPVFANDVLIFHIFTIFSIGSVRSDDFLAIGFEIKPAKAAAGKCGIDSELTALNSCIIVFVVQFIVVIYALFCVFFCVDKTSY